MRVINLCRGSGNGVDRACLASAIGMVCGEIGMGCKPNALCPSMYNFIYGTNDRMPEEVRDRLYGPLVYELAGTGWATQQVIEARRNHIRARVKGLLASRCTLPKFTRALEEAGWSPASGATIDNAIAADPGTALALLASYVDSSLWEECPKILLEAAAIGDKRPVEVVIPPDELAVRLDRERANRADTAYEMVTGDAIVMNSFSCGP
jgi:hypothetical protein